jgi:hypothetical protein
MLHTNCLATKFYIHIYIHTQTDTHVCTYVRANYINYATDSQWSTCHQFRIINYKITKTLEQNLWLQQQWLWRVISSGMCGNLNGIMKEYTVCMSECSDYSLTLKMETVHSSETSGNIYLPDYMASHPRWCCSSPGHVILALHCIFQHLPKAYFNTCCLLCANFLLRLLFNPEDKGNMLLWNVGWLLLDYTILYAMRQNSSRQLL